MEMEEVDRKYLYVNKKCGLAAGTWPFGSSWKKWICRFVVTCFCATGVTTQIAYLSINRGIDAIIEQCPFFLMGLGIMIKESNYIIQEKKLREIFEIIYKDWVMKRPKEEMDIMDKFARRGLFFNHLYVATGIFTYVSFTTVAITPRVLDLISPINGTRGVGFIYPAYYGVDEEEYYYYLMGHMLGVINIVFVVFISCDTMYMNILQHACGLFGVCGYRFKYAIGETDENVGTHHAMKLEETYRRVCHSIKAHQHAIDYIMRIIDMHAVYLFIAVGLIMIAFSVTLVRMSTMDLCMDFYKYCGFLVVQIIHLLFLIIQGHFIILSHDETYNDICQAMWYNATSRTQSLYLLAMRRNLTSPLLTAGGLISLNLETFAEILKASVSWFTVMKST